MSNAPAGNAATPIAAIDGEEIQRHASNFLADSVEWVMRYWLEILIAGAVAACIMALLYFVRAGAMRICRKRDNVGGWGTILGRAVARTSSFFITMVSIRLVSGYAGAPGAIEHTIAFLFTVSAAFQAAIWLRELILGVVETRVENNQDATGESLGSALSVIRLLTSIALFSLATVVVLSNVGVNVTGLVAGLGIGGIAIGLAAQGIFADLISALSILFDKPFRRGDTIAFGGQSGSVQEIGLKTTRIRALTGEELIVSNKNLLDKEIANNSRRTHIRAKFALGVIYQTPPAVAEKIPAMLREIVETHGMEFVRSGFVGFGASSLDFELEFDSPGGDFQAFYDGRAAVGLAILKRFNAEGIDFAYPTQTTFTAAPDGRMILPYPAGGMPYAGH